MYPKSSRCDVHRAGPDHADPGSAVWAWSGSAMLEGGVSRGHDHRVFARDQALDNPGGLPLSDVRTLSERQAGPAAPVLGDMLMAERERQRQAPDERKAQRESPTARSSAWTRSRRVSRIETQRSWCPRGDVPASPGSSQRFSFTVPLTNSGAGHRPGAAPAPGPAETRGVVPRSRRGSGLRRARVGAKFRRGSR
jgi:hypothetical protein